MSRAVPTFDPPSYEPNICRTIRLFMFVACLAGICFWVTSAGAASRSSAFAISKFGLHYAGPHDSKSNTCELDFDSFGCSLGPNDFVVDAPGLAGRYDIYVVALCVEGDLAGARYGICCSGPFYFYGWTKCSDFEIPTSGWPGCGEANAQTWTSQQPGQHVAMGILDVYAYGDESSFGLCEDQRVGFAEYCDASEPSPSCKTFTHETDFSVVGFGEPGWNGCPCSPDPVRASTWGTVKALYR